MLNPILHIGPWVFELGFVPKTFPEFLLFTPSKVTEKILWNHFYKVDFLEKMQIHPLSISHLSISSFLIYFFFSESRYV